MFPTNFVLNCSACWTCDQITTHFSQKLYREWLSQAVEIWLLDFSSFFFSLIYSRYKSLSLSKCSYVSSLLLCIFLRSLHNEKFSRWLCICLTLSITLSVKSTVVYCCIRLPIPHLSWKMIGCKLTNQYERKLCIFFWLSCVRSHL